MNASTNWSGSINRLEYGDGGEKESAEPEVDNWNIDDLTESEENLSQETESEDGESEFHIYREVMENELNP